MSQKPMNLKMGINCISMQQFVTNTNAIVVYRLLTIEDEFMVK